MKLRLAILHSARPTPWLSCRTIGANLRVAYQHIGAELAEFSLAPEFDQSELKQLIQQIAKFNPTDICLVDYFPHPTGFLKALAKTWPRAQRPRVQIHVYGDFILFGETWLEAERALRGLRLRWITPSSSHRALLLPLLRSRSSAVLTCPFPFDRKRFSPNEARRQQMRHSLGLKARQKMILYTGRLSLQKNVATLCEVFARAQAQSPLPLVLTLVGRVDGRGAPYFGVRQQLGDYDQHLLSTLKRLNLHYPKHVRILDWRDQTELVGLYNAADSFASLSTYHDEDFGMSPLEALGTGTPSTLTAWGGYRDFVDPHGSVQVVPVRIDGKGLYLNPVEASRAILTCTLNPNTESTRQQRAGSYADRFSIAPVSARLNFLLNQDSPPLFNGFSTLFKKVFQTASRHGPLFASTAKSSFYHRLYGAYFENKIAHPPADLYP